MPRLEAQLEGRLIDGEHWIRASDVTDLLRRVSRGNLAVEQQEAALMLMRVAEALDFGVIELASEESR